MKHLGTLGVLMALVFFQLPVAFAASEDRRGDSAERLEDFTARVEEHLRGITDRIASFRDDEIVVKFAGEEKALRVPVRDRSIADALREYRGREDIVYAEPNYIAYAFVVPNDPYYQYQWNFDNAINGGVHAEAAWEKTTGSGVTVAVVDTGVAYENYQQGFFTRYYQAPDLANTAFVSGYDFVGNDSHPNDDNGHGTHVAGTIAGTTGNSVGVAGLAYGATIMPIKVLDRNGSGTYYDVADGIRYAADHGAKVINLSLGGSSSATYLEEAVAYAFNKGVTIVAASGNNGSGSVSYPAAYDAYVIAVGATRFDETKASYANYGASLDIVAPGGDTSVDQNNDGYGDGIMQQTFSGNTNNFNYYFYQGTSMAAPHAAAAAAMVIAEGASSPEAVRSALESTADDLGQAGRDNTYGHGLLNVAKAVGASENPAPEPEPIDAVPHVSIVSPSAGATLSGTVTIKSDPTDDQGIEKVEILIDGDLLQTVTSAPFEAIWDTTGVADGAHTISVVAYDTALQTATDEIEVTVQNSTVTPPSGEEIVFSESFESSLGQWTQDSQRDWALSTQRAQDGSRSAEVDGRATNAALISTPVALNGHENARISFSWLIESGFDAGEYVAFDVSTDGGSTWSEKARLRGDVDAENTWREVHTDLSSIASLRLRFRGYVSGSSEDANVDKVTVIAY